MSVSHARYIIYNVRQPSIWRKLILRLSFETSSGRRRKAGHRVGLTDQPSCFQLRQRLSWQLKTLLHCWVIFFTTTAQDQIVKTYFSLESGGWWRDAVLPQFVCCELQLSQSQSNKVFIPPPPSYLSSSLISCCYL